MLNDSRSLWASNTPIPLERSAPVSFKRLLGRTLKNVENSLGGSIRFFFGNRLKGP